MCVRQARVAVNLIVFPNTIRAFAEQSVYSSGVVRNVRVHHLQQKHRRNISEHSSTECQQNVVAHERNSLPCRRPDLDDWFAQDLINNSISILDYSRNYFSANLFDNDATCEMGSRNGDVEGFGDWKSGSHNHRRFSHQILMPVRFEFVFMVTTVNLFQFSLSD